MKLCHFGWSNSSHVRRWVSWFAARGHESHLVTDLANEIEGVTIHVLPSFREYDFRPRWDRFKDWSFHDHRLRYLKVLKWARDRVNEIDPDIVHSHILWYPGMLGAFVPSKKYVITVFNGDVSWRKDRKPINRLGVRYALHKADIITSVSKNLLEDCRCWGAREKKLHRIMRGVDLARFHPPDDRQGIRDKLGLGPGPMVLSPRSAGKLYNLDTILLSTAKIIKQIPNVQVVFVWQSATEEQKALLVKLASDLDVERNIHFAGEVPYENIHLYNQAADLMVSVPSSDGVSSSILEAMACGAVPVASNLPTTREWVKDNGDGFLVTPRDVNGIAAAIIDLFSNEEKRREMARRNVEKMRLEGDQDMWMGKMEELYYSLMKEKSWQND